MRLQLLIFGRYTWLFMAASVLLLSACRGGVSPPPTDTPVPTATPVPTETPLPTDTPTPLPTNTPIIPESSISVGHPDPEQVRTDEQVALVLKLDPDIDTETHWILQGGGSLDTNTGKTVIFTAPDKAGAAIIMVEGTTIEGAQFEVITTLQIVEEPTPTPIPRPTRELVCDPPFEAKPNNRITLPASTIIGEITTPSHCSNEHSPNPDYIATGGTAVDVPEDSYLWLFVYAVDGKYYPQCDDALEGRCGANYSQGSWGVRTHLGQKGCKEHFHLVLIETNSDGDEFLTNTMMSWAEKNEYEGFTQGQLQERGILEVDSIQIETAGQLGCP